MLSSTMLYILWIGFYPPGQDPSRIFFIDRLQDFKDLLDGLRDGSIQASIINSFAIAFKNVLVQQYDQYYPKNDIPDGTPNPYNLPPGNG